MSDVTRCPICEARTGALRRWREELDGARRQLAEQGGVYKTDYRREGAA